MFLWMENIYIYMYKNVIILRRAILVLKDCIINVLKKSKEENIMHFYIRCKSSKNTMLWDISNKHE